MSQQSLPLGQLPLFRYADTMERALSEPDLSRAVKLADQLACGTWSELAALEGRRLLSTKEAGGVLRTGDGVEVPLSECTTCGHRSPFHPLRPEYFAHDCEASP